jgi:hypothetical protein
MDWYDGSAAVGVAKKVVAAPDPCDLEACLPQGGNDFSPVIRGRRVTPR